MNIRSRVAAVPGITLRKRISNAIEKYNREAMRGCFLDSAIDEIKTTRIKTLNIYFYLFEKISSRASPSLG